LGCYEAELQPYISETIHREYLAVVDIGCAEGYYLIGLARAMPEVACYGFDVDPRALAICRQAAKENGVHDERIELSHTCTREAISAVLAGNQPAFVLVDCEGAEKDLLQPDRVPLDGCDILVECHECFDPLMASELESRFSETHAITRITEGPRDPNRHPFMRKLSSTDRWLLVSEGRPETMTWLMCRSRLNARRSAGA
jgi:SAM-dependent methyltransferase